MSIVNKPAAVKSGNKIGGSKALTIERIINIQRDKHGKL